MLIFLQHKIKYIWYLLKKGKFSFYFILKRKYTKHNQTYSLVISHLTFSVCLLGIILGVKQNLRLKNGLELYFNK